MSDVAAQTLCELLRGLWKAPASHPLRPLLPGDLQELATALDRMRAFLATTARESLGTIDPAAVVRGELVYMGSGSVIEAGAVVHESCKLYLGARSRVRAGTVLRDEVVIGDDCLVGVQCEVVRSVLLGPATILGHQVICLDSIVGAGAILTGAVALANTPLSGARVGIRVAGERVDSGRTHLGALVGDGVKVGATTMICPGTLVMPGLELPPGSVLMGIVDEAKCRRLMARLFEAWGD